MATSPAGGLWLSVTRRCIILLYVRQRATDLCSISCGAGWAFAANSPAMRLRPQFVPRTMQSYKFASNCRSSRSAFMRADTTSASIARENGAQNIALFVYPRDMLVAPQVVLHFSHEHACVTSACFQTSYSTDPGDPRGHKL